MHGKYQRAINVNKHIFGKVYFPIYSNRLKEIGAFIGATWTSPNASGLQSLVWWHCWDEIRSAEYKYLLLTYNEEDCRALKLLTDELSKIKYSADTMSEVDFANQPKQHITEVGGEVHSQFETVLKFAYTNYDKKKISFRQNKKEEKGNGECQKKQTGSKRGYQRHRKVKPKATKTIQIPQRKFCPKCENAPLRPTKRTSVRLIIDLVSTKNGMRKTITEYVGIKGYCPKCYRYHVPPDISKYYASHLYGHKFKAWIVYQRVGLRTPYESIIQMVEEQFNEKISPGIISHFVKDFACYYIQTEKFIVKNLLKSPFIHADETPVNIKGVNQYVWVFTDGKYVVFKLRQTRKATVAHEFLADYNGILISDFYPGYDSMKCRQQKCWSHLIRDLNNDLWANPFDIEYETFILEVRNLIIPIMEDVQIYGLKKRNLGKFKGLVDKFYKKIIIDQRYKSELTIKYQDRFIRYRESLFTFLEQDGIPWHNNTAEIALRHLTVQEKISGCFHESLMPDYLCLLGIRQTCRFQGKSFFKFLFSEETDLDKLEARKYKTRA